MIRQRTIDNPVTLTGLGLFSGRPCRVKLLPAGEGAGIVFVRTNAAGSAARAEEARIPATSEYVVRREHRTGLANGGVQVETVEHLLAAVWGMGVDNVVIEIDGDEVPSTDGSAAWFAQAIREGGIREQHAAQVVHVISEPVTVSNGPAMLAALPGADDALEIFFDLDYSDTPCVGRQAMSYRLTSESFLTQIAPARTFCRAAEARALQADGQCVHLTAKDILVLDPAGPIDNNFRFPDEPVRHKICDLIGDLALLGRRLAGRIVASQSGHELTIKLVRELAARIAGATLAGTPALPVMDIRKVMRLLPHRYPFLMIDRVVSIEEGRRAVGIKNVTINEPFFQGHYPGQPIMPGVLILEAMAQLSGILLGRHLEHTGKVAFLLSMDRVKMRRPVQPGDQLILEAEALHVRPRTGHCRCTASVGDEVAAEAEIKFMLVDAEPV